MEVLISVLTVLFIILAGLLVIIILLQSDKSAGMGILGGSSQSTFGSSTADVITKVTGVMVGLFMAGSLGLAVLESYSTSSLESELKSDVPNIEALVESKDAVKESDNIKSDNQKEMDNKDNK
ncbi:MAG: preprotein translocase subunit SecG [Spirochaetota bacterium]|nr:preprotein translocase subunit SecG [Spirochaetota bacterium]